MTSEFALIILASFLAIMSITYMLCLHKENLRLMETVDKLQRDQSRVISEMLAHKTRLETGDSFTAGQILQHSDNHDRRAGVPDIPQSFSAGITADDDVQAVGLHESPEILYGEDLAEPPGPGVET